MPRQFKQARLINNLKMTEAAKKPGISQPTLSAWEVERKSPSIDGLEKRSWFCVSEISLSLSLTIMDKYFSVSC